MLTSDLIPGVKLIRGQAVRGAHPRRFRRHKNVGRELSFWFNHGELRSAISPPLTARVFRPLAHEMCGGSYKLFLFIKNICNILSDVIYYSPNALILALSYQPPARFIIVRSFCRF